jgi:hypothetical protein
MTRPDQLPGSSALEILFNYRLTRCRMRGIIYKKEVCHEKKPF